MDPYGGNGGFSPGPPGAGPPPGMGMNMGMPGDPGDPMGGELGGPPPEGGMGMAPGMGMEMGMGPPPSGMDMGYGDGSNGGKSGGGAFRILMMIRKILSVCAMIAVIVFEAAIAIQDAQLKLLSPALQGKNTFRKRDLLGRAVGLVLAAKKAESRGLKKSCDYWSGFDVPDVIAGQARSCLYHLSNSIALLGLLWCERPGSKGVADILGVSSMILPPTRKIGLVTFSILQTWFASSVLNHYISTAAYATAYILLITSLTSLFLGLIFMKKLKQASNNTGGLPPGDMGMGMGPPGMDMMGPPGLDMPPGMGGPSEMGMGPPMPGGPQMY